MPKRLAQRFLRAGKKRSLKSAIFTLRQHLSGRVKPLETRREQLLSALSEQRNLSPDEALAYLEVANRLSLSGSRS